MAARVISTVLLPAVTLFATDGKPHDLIDLATLKDILGITKSETDDFFAKTITRASEQIIRHCNRVFQPQTYQDQIWAQRDPLPGGTIPGGLDELQLAAFPLLGSASTAGIAPPAAAPTMSAIAAGTLAAQKCFARITYLTATGETAASLEGVLPIGADQVLQVASPPVDQERLATGWNVYVGPTANGETLQNTQPIAIGTAWTMPTSGLVPGSALPAYPLVIANANASPPQTLAEGVDFLVDRINGEVVRLGVSGLPRKWSTMPILVQYQAGYTAITDDVQEACTRLVKLAYFARNRDPMVRQENIGGFYEAQYWFASGPGATSGSLPPDVEDLLTDYRVPQIG